MSEYLTEVPRLIYDVPKWFNPEDEASQIAAPIYGVINNMTEAELKIELNRIHNMQIECGLCINKPYSTEALQERAKDIQYKLRQKESEIENKLKDIVIAERIARLDEIERELNAK